MQKQEYTVYVDDNYHYMQEDERYTAGVYDSYEEALAKCKQIVDGYLQGVYTPGMTADDLYSSYTDYGDDPFIVPDPNQFSAWDYAKQRSSAIASK